MMRTEANFFGLLFDNSTKIFLDSKPPFLFYLRYIKIYVLGLTPITEYSFNCAFDRNKIMLAFGFHEHPYNPMPHVRSSLMITLYTKILFYNHNVVK